MRHIGTDRCTWWRFGVLVNQLPREARYWAKVTDGRSTWSTTDHLIAAGVDMLSQLTWQDAVVNFKGVPNKPPKPLRRPGVVPTVGQTGLTGPEMIARLKAQQAREEAMTHGG